MGEVKLKIAEALQDDVYKGIARIDKSLMKDLDAKREDAILIKGGRETVAIVDKAYPADIGDKIIRIDGIIRKNAKTSVGKEVIVKKADINVAKKIRVVPIQRNIRVQGDLKPGLLGRCVLKEDIVVLGGVQRRKDLMSDEFGGMDDIFGNLSEMLGGMGGADNLGGMQQIRFKIKDLIPNNPCIITENTIIELDNHPEVNLSDEEEMFGERKIIELKKLPDLKQYYEVRDLENFYKVISKTGDHLLNSFKDKDKTYYLIANYCFIVNNKKK